MEKNKAIGFRHAMTSVTVMAALVLICVVVFGADPQIPLIFGCLAAGLVAFFAGFSWDDILSGMVEGVKQSVEAVFILLLIGMLVGIWIASGTVPSMIYYGLSLVNAQFFLVAAMAVCSLVAFAIGSWGTVGTVGLAFMGIGLALGLPAPLVAGCVISGAYFGEIVSPLSDATNLAAAIIGRDVFSVVKKMVPLAAIALIFTEIVYLVIGLQLGGLDGAQITSGIAPLKEGLTQTFSISPIALIPMIVMVACIIAKIPAIPSMIIGTIAGMVVALATQGATIGGLLDVSYTGYTSATGNTLLDGLLSAGGLESMMYAISVIVIAMGFGGLMQATGQMEALIKPVMLRIKRFPALNAFTESVCVCMNLVLPDQYLGISVPGQMLADEYDGRHFDRSELSVALLGGGAVTSPLIPWNTCGIYCAGILGISALQYAPFAIFSLVMPILVVLAGFHMTRKHEAILRACRQTG